MSADDEQPSYLREMLTSTTNLNVFLSSLAAAAVLAIPYGLAGAALPLLLFAAGETIASMFVPSSMRFRAAVDRRRARARRDRLELHLRTEIERRTGRKDPVWQTYQRLKDRAQSLREMAKARAGRTVAEADVVRMEEAALDYLGLWLAAASIRQRLLALSQADLVRRRDEMARKVAASPQDASMAKTLAELDGLIERRERLAARRAAIDAALIALPDAVEEIFHSMLTTQAPGDVGRKLAEAVDRLHVEEQLDASFDEELRVLLEPPAAERGLRAVVPGGEAAARRAAAARAQATTRQ